MVIVPFSNPKQLLLLIGLVLFAQVKCQDRRINCIPGTITSNGSILYGLLDAPPDYACILRFEVPKGFVIRFSLAPESKINSTEDVIFVSNVRQEILQFPDRNPVSHIFCTAGAAFLHLNPINEVVRVLIEYDFLDVRNYSGKFYNAGNYVELNFPARTFVTFKIVDPITNGKIELNTATLNKKDVPYSDVFVFEGSGLEGEYLGTLTDFDHKNNIGVVRENDKLFSYLTIVHFNENREYAESFVVSNSERSLSNFNNYSVMISTQKDQHVFANVSNGSAVITVISEYGQENYIDDLKFLVENGTIEIFAMAPYHKNSKDPRRRETWQYPIITLQNSTYNRTQLMPIRIPGKVFTIVVKNTMVSFNVSTSGYDDWLAPRAGRRTTVYSPSIWDYSTDAKFYYEFWRFGGKEWGFIVKVLSYNIVREGEFFKAEVETLHDLPSIEVVRCKHGLAVCSKNNNGNVTIAVKGPWIRVHFQAGRWPSSAVVQIDIFETNDPYFVSKLEEYLIWYDNRDRNSTLL